MRAQARHLPFAPILALSLALFGTGCEPSSEVEAAGEIDGPHRAILSQINLPTGFRIGVFAEIPNARSLAVHASTGTVFVSQRRRGGSIFSARDADGDGIADRVVRRAQGLNVPNGIAIVGDTLVVALNDKVVRWPIPADPDAPLRARDASEIFGELPTKSHHGWRYAKTGPDGNIYIAVGSPCNICLPKGLEGTLLALAPDGSAMEVVARGVRNSVGFDWHPKTGVLFFTDNGADGMGDDIPADELNRVVVPGQHFGFPYRGGAEVPLAGYECRHRHV